MTNELVGLIDADFIKYLVAYDIERMFKGGLNPGAVIPYNTIASLTEKRISKIMDDTASRSKDYIFLFSGKTRDNHRSLISCVKKYKGTRKYSEKFPLEGKYRSMVEVYIEEHYNYHKEDDLEADDLCVMAHKDGTYIYSNDKDLKMSPGIHFDMTEKKFTKTSEEKGFRVLMTQTLSGDSVDNIAGMEGVGKVGANKIVSKESSMDDIIVATIKTYTKKHGYKNGLDRFVEMYSLVNLKTDRGDWTKEKYATFFNKMEKLLEKKKDKFDLF